MSAILAADTTAGLSALYRLGTAAEAAGRAVISIGTGIVIDGVLLEAEEASSREDLRREIVTAIRASHVVSSRIRCFVQRTLRSRQTPERRCASTLAEPAYRSTARAQG